MQLLLLPWQADKPPPLVPVAPSLDISQDISAAGNIKHNENKNRQQHAVAQVCRDTVPAFHPSPPRDAVVTIHALPPVTGNQTGPLLPQGLPPARPLARPYFLSSTPYLELRLHKARLPVWTGPYCTVVLPSTRTSPLSPVSPLHQSPPCPSIFWDFLFLGRGDTFVRLCCERSRVTLPPLLRSPSPPRLDLFKRPPAPCWAPHRDTQETRRSPLAHLINRSSSAQFYLYYSSPPPNGPDNQDALSRPIVST